MIPQLPELTTHPPVFGERGLWSSVEETAELTLKTTQSTSLIWVGFSSLVVEPSLEHRVLCV